MQALPEIINQILLLNTYILMQTLMVFFSI